jgi:hypothetical protein
VIKAICKDKKIAQNEAHKDNETRKKVIDIIQFRCILKIPEIKKRSGIILLKSNLNLI